MTSNIINAEHKIKVSEETRKAIFKKVEENYMGDVEEMICGKKCWRRTGLSFETMSKITIAIGGVLSFSSGYFDSNILSFISGSVSVISLALLQFGSYGFLQSKKRGNDLNILLKKLDLDTIPVIEENHEALTSGNNKTILFKGVKDNSEDNTEQCLSDTPKDKQIDNENMQTENIDLEINDLPSSIKNITIIDSNKSSDSLKPENITTFTIV